MLTIDEEPLNDSAFPNLPCVDHVVAETVPLLPNPEPSATVDPDPSSNEYAATRPTGGVAVVALATFEVWAEVAGGVDRAYLVPVGRSCSEARGVDVHRSGPARLRQMREVGARRALAPVDAVAGDADVVCRCAPGQVDFTSARRGGGQGSGRGRRVRVRRADPDGCSHVGLDRCLRESAVVDAHLVDQAAEGLSVDAVAADLQLTRRTGDRPCLRLTGHQPTVHIEPQRRTVVGHSQKRPRVERQHRRGERIRVATPERAPAAGNAAAAVRRRHQVVVVVALVDHIAPRRRDGRGVHPRLERHRRAQLQRRRIRNIHTSIRPVERQGTAELPRRRPGRVRDRPVVPTPRRICHRRPRPCIKRILSNQAVGHVAGRDGHGVGVRTGVSGRIGGTDTVGVGGFRGERRILVARAARGADLREARTAAAQAPFDPVARHADIVRRGAPREIDLGRPDRRARQRSGCRWRRRIRAGCGRLRDGRDRRDVGRGVYGGDAQGVGGAAVEAPEDVVERKRRRNLGAADVDPVTGHPDVVGRRRPRKRERALAGCSDDQPARGRRWHGVPAPTAAPDGCRHVGLDRGLRECDVVDPHLVDQALEVLAVDAVAADLELTRGGRDGARRRLASDERAVDIRPDGRPVVRRREERPRVER